MFAVTETGFKPYLMTEFGWRGAPEIKRTGKRRE
jgi:hypothetical protein